MLAASALTLQDVMEELAEERASCHPKVDGHRTFSVPARSDDTTLAGAPRSAGAPSLGVMDVTASPTSPGGRLSAQFPRSALVA